MNKKLSVILLSLLLALLCSQALADRPVNPYYDASRPPSRSVLQSQPKGFLDMTVSFLSGPMVGGESVWEVTTYNFVGDCTYECHIIDSEWETVAYFPPQADPRFSYEFLCYGEYTIIVTTLDSVGNSYEYTMGIILSDPLDPSGDLDNAQVAEVVNRLAAECLAAGCTTDFEKALWMHDWLIMNASYDLTYQHYSADGVLLRGIGVCDSYRKAYELLLKAVGVEATSVAGGNHAWNQVKMDGKWYNVDVTWDDPTISNAIPQPTVSGAENHMYFGLPTSLMKLDHTFEIDRQECTSLDMNYYIQTGKHSWWSTNPVNYVKNAIADKQCAFNVRLELFYTMEGGYVAEPALVSHIIAYVLENQEYDAGSRMLRVNVDHPDDYNLFVTADLEAYELDLPENIAAVEQEAFSGATGFMSVTVPSGAVLGDRCFSGCTDLWQVIIPDDVTSISDTAFEGCGNVTIFCSNGSYAYEYALRHGMSVQLQ